MYAVCMNFIKCMHIGIYVLFFLFYQCVYSNNILCYDIIFGTVRMDGICFSKWDCASLYAC